jgi:hypothetical protein
MRKTELKTAELATLVSRSIESSSAGGRLGVEVGRTSEGFKGPESDETVHRPRVASTGLTPVG